MSKPPSSVPERRSFLTGVNAAMTSLAAMTIGSSIARGQVKSASAARFEPARHDKDDWMDGLPGKHRLVFDTTTEDGFKDALRFANNFYIVNRDDYGLENKDLAVIIVARHLSTGFGYKNEMWTKYGAQMLGPGGSNSPGKEAAKTNTYASAMDALSKQGVQFAVCAMATSAIAGFIAKAAGGREDTYFTELTSNLVSNARMVPAGIVAINRAQERGYSLVTA